MATSPVAPSDVTWSGLFNCGGGGPIVQIPLMNSILLAVKPWWEAHLPAGQDPNGHLTGIHARGQDFNFPSSSASSARDLVVFSDLTGISGVGGGGLPAGALDGYVKRDRIEDISATHKFWTTVTGHSTLTSPFLHLTISGGGVANHGNAFELLSPYIDIFKAPSAGFGTTYLLKQTTDLFSSIGMRTGGTTLSSFLFEDGSSPTNKIFFYFNNVGARPLTKWNMSTDTFIIGVSGTDIANWVGGGYNQGLEITGHISATTGITVSGSSVLTSASVIAGGGGGGGTGLTNALMGTANQITVTSGSNQVVFSLPNIVAMPGSLTVSGSAVLTTASANNLTATKVFASPTTYLPFTHNMNTTNVVADFYVPDVGGSLRKTVPDALYIIDANTVSGSLTVAKAGTLVVMAGSAFTSSAALGVNALVGAGTVTITSGTNTTTITSPIYAPKAEMGTANQITVTSGSNQIVFSLPNPTAMPGGLTISGSPVMITPSGIVENEHAFIQIPDGATRYVLSSYSFYPFRLTDINAKTQLGTCSGTFDKNSIDIIGVNNKVINTASGLISPTSTTNFAVGDVLGFTVSGTTTASGVQLSWRQIRTA